MIVVDASLATKWLLEEAESEQARTFLTQHIGQMSAPDLLLSEVAGAIIAATNMTRISPNASRLATETWCDFWSSGSIGTVRLGTKLIGQASEIARTIGHPLPDCVYLALAIDLQCDLATCDVKFRDKAFTVFPSVKLLAELV